MIFCILEDNLTLQMYLKKIISEWAEVREVICVGSNEEFFSLDNISKIDFFLADLVLPDGLAIKSIEKYIAETDQGFCLVISNLFDGDVIISALRAGAVGYLHKDDSPLNIREQIEFVRDGGSPMSPLIAHNLIKEIQSSNVSTKVIDGDHRLGAEPQSTILTERECEVINLIAKGLTYLEVASVLSLSKHTVPGYIRTIYRKLQAHNRSEAVFEARSLGLID